MNRVFILRHSKDEYGAFGTMFNHNLIPFAVTLENEETLIPSGILIANSDYYHAGGYPTFEIQIEGRDRLLFHKLNWDFQSQGCIGIGESYEPLFSKRLGKILPAISQSDKGFNEFWNLYKDFKQIEVVVIEHYMEEAWHRLSQ